MVGSLHRVWLCGAQTQRPASLAKDRPRRRGETPDAAALLALRVPAWWRRAADFRQLGRLGGRAWLGQPDEQPGLRRVLAEVDRDGAHVAREVGDAGGKDRVAVFPDAPRHALRGPVHPACGGPLVFLEGALVGTADESLAVDRELEDEDRFALVLLRQCED